MDDGERARAGNGADEQQRQRRSEEEHHREHFAHKVQTPLLSDVLEQTRAI